VNTWKVILATMVIFGTGVVTGGLLVRNTRVTPGPPAAFTAQQQRPLFSTAGAGFVRVELLRRAERELNLTADQRDQIDQIIRESQERTKKLMEPINPKIRDEMQQTKDKFLAILTPEQKARFVEMLKQQRLLQQRGRDPHRPPNNSSLPSPNAQPVR
jgi:Spy/CpxP family protein refolding chaperone